MSKKVRIRTFYPADPVGIVPGGIDTFLRGLIKWAPPELEFSLVGMTTEPTRRPLGRWSTCDLGRRQFQMFPLLAIGDAGKRSRIPLSLQFTAALHRRRQEILGDFDIFEFHRIEPLLAFRNDARPKNAFFHQDMSVIGSKKSDIFWRHFPAAYFFLERRLFPALRSAYCVREEGAEILRRRYTALAKNIRFIPTWVDTEIFYPAGTAEQRKMSRAELRASMALPQSGKVVMTVGRLDTQKNPQLLLAAFGRLLRHVPDAVLIFVGDGVLRPEIAEEAKKMGIEGSVRFAGLVPPVRIAEMLRGADVFALSSRYEGMPMALLEALGTGVPVVTTDVGEVKRVVTDGKNGYIVPSHEPEDFCESLRVSLLSVDGMSGQSSVQSIQPFKPEIVLQPVYENYMRMGSHHA